MLVQSERGREISKWIFDGIKCTKSNCFLLYFEMLKCLISFPKFPKNLQQISFTKLTSWHFFPNTFLFCAINGYLAVRQTNQIERWFSVRQTQLTVLHSTNTCTEFRGESSPSLDAEILYINLWVEVQKMAFLHLQ